MSRVDKEGPIHRSILNHLRARFPGAVVVHAANEVPLAGKNVARAIAKAKWNGMLPGFPDLAVFLPQGECVLFEVKAPGGAIQPSQKSILKQLSELGFRNAVVRSVADVDACITEWGLDLQAAWTPNDFRDLRDRLVGKDAL